MKSTHLVAAAAGLLALVLLFMWWRQGDLSDEIAVLRSQVASLKKMPELPEKGRGGGSETPAVPESAAGAPVPDVPASAEDRLADLERVVNGQADIIEDLLAKLNGMEEKERKAAAPGWSALQATGAPDSGPGDQRTAWAPATENGGQEWLQVEFDQPAEARTIIVRENCAPGAIVRISAVGDDGAETPLWQGQAPKVMPVSNTPFAAATPVLTKRLKIYLDTGKVPGWNEIDAVQLIGADGTRQWASNATASSSYGGNSGGAVGLGDTTTLRFESEGLLRSYLQSAPNEHWNEITDFYRATPAGEASRGAREVTTWSAVVPRLNNAVGEAVTEDLNAVESK